MQPNYEEQEKAADELHAKVYGNPGKVDEAAPPPPAPAPEAAPKAEVKAEETIKPLKAPVGKEEDLTYWKNRAEVLAGKYEAEVPRYATDNRNLKSQLEIANAEVERLKAAPPAKEVEAEIPSDLIEKYGSEFIADVKKIMPQPQQKTDDPLVGKITKLEQEISEDRYNKFLDQLSVKAPKWEALNTDKNFLTWLAGIDEMSGRPRQDLFDQAVAERNPVRAAVFFNSFGGTDQSWDEKRPAYVPPPIEEQLAPATSKASESPPGKKIWATSELEQFYVDLRKGRISDEDASRIEADIFAAQREGRIQG